MEDEDRTGVEARVSSLQFFEQATRDRTEEFDPGSD
jgi:hypothetical protein